MLMNCASITSGRNGVAVPVGVTEYSGVSVMVGVSVIVGDRVMVGMTEGVGEGATVGEGGKYWKARGVPTVGSRMEIMISNNAPPNSHHALAMRDWRRR